jgi:hypothetical protein
MLRQWQKLLWKIRLMLWKHRAGRLLDGTIPNGSREKQARRTYLSSVLKRTLAKLLVG